MAGKAAAVRPSGAGTLSSQYDVYAADVDLVDDTPPSVSGVSGPLLAGGTLAGQQAVSFDASDGQSGVYGGSLVVDGHTVVSQILDTNGGACQSLNVTTDGQRSFEHAQPCQSIAERQPDAQHEPAGRRPALAGADRRRRRRKPDDRLQRHDHDERPAVDRRQRRIDQRRATPPTSAHIANGSMRRRGARTRGQRQAQATDFAMGRPSRSGACCTAAPSRSATPGSRSRRSAARPARRSTPQCRPLSMGRSPTGCPRARIARWGSPTPRTATIPAPPRPRPPRSRSARGSS